MHNKKLQDYKRCFAISENDCYAMIILKYLTNTEYFCICSKREVFLQNKFVCGEKLGA